MKIFYINTAGLVAVKKQVVAISPTNDLNKIPLIKYLLLDCLY